MRPQHNVINDLIINPLITQMATLQKNVEGMQLSNKKTYSSHDLHHYLYGPTIYMPPLP